eukprot:XP_017951095.1 PREDICTED: olfactory receptor 8H1-like [Xenopus tropicalis]
MATSHVIVAGPTSNRMCYLSCSFPQCLPLTSCCTKNSAEGPSRTPPWDRCIHLPPGQEGRLEQMASESKENVSGFIIQGFSDTPELQMSLFVLFLGIYLIILLGNLIIFLVISCNPHLHTPMYIFLLNLSFIDISFTSNILPNLLHILLTQQNNISFLGCMAQMYVFGLLASSEYFLLTAMAYDRYVAICDPLHYIARMSRKHCAGLITAAFTGGFVESISLIVPLSKLSYCASRLINHFFCDVTPLLKLSCSSTFSVELFIYVGGTLFTFRCNPPLDIGLDIENGRRFKQKKYGVGHHKVLPWLERKSLPGIMQDPAGPSAGRPRFEVHLAARK